MSINLIKEVHQKYIPQRGLVKNNYNFFLRALAIAGKVKKFSTQNEFETFQADFKYNKADTFYFGNLVVEFNFQWKNLEYRPIGFTITIERTQFSKSWYFNDLPTFDIYSLAPKEIIDESFKDTSGIQFFFDENLEKEWDAYLTLVYLKGENVPYCPSDRIFDPDSGDCVLKSSGLGLQLQNIAHRPDSLCFKVGLMQKSGTCWFNSVMNGLILAEATYKILYSKYKQLSDEEKSELMADYSPSATCPRHLKKLHFYKIFQEFVFDKHKNTLNNNIADHSRKLIDKLEVRSSPDWHDNSSGYDPKQAVKKILPILFDKDEYMICNYNQPITPLETTRIIFIQKSRGFFKEIKDIPIPKGWKIVSALIGILYEDEDQDPHVIVGFVCNNTKYIYDSNEFKVREVDFTNEASIQKSIPGVHTTFYSSVCIAK